jgi:hypothetical protein
MPRVLPSKKPSTTSPGRHQSSQQGVNMSASTVVNIYTGVFIKEGTQAVCGLLIEINGTVDYQFIEMENVKGLCTLLSNEIRKWQKSKSVMGNIKLTVQIHERNLNAYKAISKVVKALNEIPVGTVGEPRKNLIKFHIRNRNYTKQLAYAELTELTNEVLNYNQMPSEGTIEFVLTQNPGVGYLKAIYGATLGHWHDLQDAKSLPSNVVQFPQSITPKK